MTDDIQRFLRRHYLPHIWCPGCGHGIVLGAVLRAIARAGLDQDKVAIVSGIGCASRAPGYMDFCTLHATHGRAIPFATGLKFARPELKVIVLTGDGDVAAIGGNHLIHAARRNIGLVTVVFNNSIYGMTSGQCSPMTPTSRFATTAPYGNLERPFDLCALVAAAGATYVARSTAYHARQLTTYVGRALDNKGFSLVEAVSQCPTYYGRRNKLGAAVAMLEWQKDNAVPASAAETLPPEERREKIITGEFVKQPAPEFTEIYDQLIDRLGR
jgi:2-oxoglutarate ferredoxin oxidoreductase subunit beta